VFGIFDHPGINHHPDVAKEVLEEPCKEILREFFRKRREK
jgi:tRNA(Arg) A34 adenosine deaminase TadA